MDDLIDLLQIKIEKAKAELPEDTLNAINAVDWKAVILGLRESKGYSFEQLGSLELETELVLCGLLNPKDYSRELENRMKITKAQANELVNEMNIAVFAKIREELIKNADRKKIFEKKIEENKDTQVLKDHDIEIIPNLPTVPSAQLMQTEKKEEITHPILAQKLFNSVQTKVVETDHSLQNLSSTNTENITKLNNTPKIDPYREIPE